MGLKWKGDGLEEDTIYLPSLFNVEPGEDSIIKKVKYNTHTQKCNLELQNSDFFFLSPSIFPRHHEKWKFYVQVLTCLVFLLRGFSGPDIAVPLV